MNDEPPMRGREQALQRLSSALRDPAARLVVVSGAGGSGKSLLAQAACEALGDAILTGRAQFGQAGGSPLSPLLLGLEGAVEQALGALYDPDAALSTLSSILGDTAVSFFALPPGLLRSLAEKARPAHDTVSSEAALERLAQAILRTLRWLTAVRPATVLILDDWGRAGPVLQRLLARLRTEASSLTVVATERSEEAASLDQGPQVRLELGPIDDASRRRLLGDQVDDDALVAAELDAFLGESSLPFDLLQQVAALKASGALSHEGTGWRFEAAAGARALGAGIADSLVRRLAAATPLAQRAARLLTLFSGDAAVADLRICLRASQANLDAALRELQALGMVERRRAYIVRFSHDRVRSAVADLLSDAERRGLAEKTAESLRGADLRPAAAGDGEVMLRCRLLAGLDRCASAEWAELFLQGARTARVAGDAELGAAWARPALTLYRAIGHPPAAALREGIFAAIVTADMAAAEALAREMLASAASPKGEAEAYEMAIFVRRVDGDIEGAIQLAREALARHGIRLPQRTERVALLAAAVRVLASDPAAAARATITDEEELEVYGPLLRALNATGSLLYEREPMLAVLFAVNSVPWKLAAGTAAGAGTYSTLCSAFGAFRRGEQWAQLSDARQAPGQPLRALALQYSTNFGHAMVHPRQSARARLDEMESLAYAEGDLTVAAYANRRRVLDRLYSEQPLPAIRTVLADGLATAQRLRDAPTLTTVAALNQVVECLAGDSPTPWRLSGAYFDDAAFEASPLAQATHVARNVHSLAALLAAAFGAYETGAAIYLRTRRFFRPPAFQLLAQTWTFATTLALLRTGARPDAWRIHVLRHHAKMNPTDHRHRLLLIEAEVRRVAGRRREAILRYEQALEAASRSECRIEHGVIASAAVEGAALLGEHSAALRYAAERDGVWAAFGATAVLRALHPGAELPAVDPAPPEAAPPSGEWREQELAAARAAAERSSSAKSRLLADVAHELRTPLQGAVDLLDGGAPPDPADALALRGTLRHLATVVDDLADMGALESGGLALAERSFDPVQVLRDVAQMHRAQANGRSILVMADPAPPALLGDEVRVRQVVSNLVSNALKYGEGDVRLRLAFTPGERIGLTIEVADRGRGLSPESLATIFEPFKRGPGDTDKDGLGLGLPIARRIARAMGGELTAEPAEQGALFRFAVSLPRANGARTVGSRAQRVLLAEDVSLSRAILRRFLEQEGCEVVEAADGDAAVRLWSADRFDLVVTDERMPGHRGSELARILRQRGFAGPIAIVAGADEAELREAVRDLPAVQVLRKPVGRDQVKAYLGGEAPGPNLIGHARIQELRSALGPSADDLFADLRTALPQMVAEVRQAADAGQAASLAAAAHRLAGLANHFAQPALAAAAQTLELSAADPQATPASLAAMVARVDGLAARVDWAAYGLAEPA